MNKKKFKLSNKIYPLDGFTSATEWIEDNLKMIDLYYENQKQQGKLKDNILQNINIGRLITLGSIMEEIKPSDFNSKIQYDKTIVNLYRNFFAYHVIPTTLKDDILKTSDIRIIPALGEIFSYKPIFVKDVHKFDEICISGEKLEDVIPVEQIFCYCSGSIEFDISGRLMSFFFGQHHTITDNIIYGKLTSYKEPSEKELLKREKSLEVGVSYIKTVLGEDYFNELIIKTLDKLEDGVYVRILDGLLPVGNKHNEVIFKNLLSQLIPFIDDDDLKTEVQLHIMLN